VTAFTTDQRTRQRQRRFIMLGAIPTPPRTRPKIFSRQYGSSAFVSPTAAAVICRCLMRSGPAPCGGSPGNAPSRSAEDRVSFQRELSIGDRFTKGDKRSAVKCQPSMVQPIGSEKQSFAVFRSTQISDTAAPLRLLRVFLRSAKGAARTFKRIRNRFAPRSVSCVILRSLIADRPAKNKTGKVVRKADWRPAAM